MIHILIILMRHYKYIDHSTGTVSGDYTGFYPLQAAKKCAMRIFRKAKHQGLDTSQPIEFYIKEVTKNSSKKIHHYRATIVKYTQPRICIIMGDEIKFDYYINITKLGIIKTLSVNNVNESITHNLEINIDTIPNNKLVIKI